MKTMEILFVLSLLTLFAGTANSQTIPGRWEMVDALNSQAQINISLSSGIRLSGAFHRSTENSIFLVDAAGQLREIPKADVQRITLATTVGDTSWNGAVIGAGAGFGIGFLLGGLSGESDEKYPKVGSRVFGPIGAAAGCFLAIWWTRVTKQRGKKLYTRVGNRYGYSAAVRMLYRLMLSNAIGAERAGKVSALIPGRRMAMSLKKLMCCLLVGGILHAFVPIELWASKSQQQEQTLAKMKAIVQKAWSKNKAVNVLMKDKQKLSGHVTNVTDDGFTVSSAAPGAHLLLAFTEVQKVKQKGMHPAVKAAIVIGIVVGAVVGISYAAYCGSSPFHC